MTRLSVNLNKIAVLRNSRGGGEPDVVRAARACLDNAMQQNRRCVRASLLQGELLLQEGKPEEAIAAWQRIEQQDPPYLTLVAQRLLEAYRKLERRDEGIALLRAFKFPFRN